MKLAFAKQISTEISKFPRKTASSEEHTKHIPFNMSHATEFGFLEGCEFRFHNLSADIIAHFQDECILKLNKHIPTPTQSISWEIPPRGAFNVSLATLPNSRVYFPLL